MQKLLPAIYGMFTTNTACCVSTSRTARSRTSGENLFGRLMAPLSQAMEPPTKPGRFTARAPGDGRIVPGSCYATQMADAQSIRASVRGAPFTVSFMAICALVFLVGLVSPIAQREIFLRFSQINVAVGEGEWWRLFTSAFLHAGPAHIAFNMWALYQFGPPLERQIGTAAFAAMCLACAAWGGTAVYLLTGPRSAVVGASSAIFGVFGAWLYASYLSRETPMGQAQFRNLMNLLAINAFLSFAVPRT